MFIGLGSGASKAEGAMTQEQTATVVVQSVYRTVRTSRLYEQIVQQIEESILGGALKPGDQLPAERELAQ